MYTVKKRQLLRCITSPFDVEKDANALTKQQNAFSHLDNGQHRVNSSKLLQVETPQRYSVLGEKKLRHL